MLLNRPWRSSRRSSDSRLRRSAAAETNESSRGTEESAAGSSWSILLQVSEVKYSESPGAAMLQATGDDKARKQPNQLHLSVPDCHKIVQLGILICLDSGISGKFHLESSYSVFKVREWTRVVGGLHHAEDQIIGSLWCIITNALEGKGA